MTEFIESLASALKSELEPYMDEPVFLDENRLKPGFRFNEALAHGICSSACWIMVYVPQYSKREYCMREFQAMLDLERMRREALGDRLDARTGMIIPILLRGTLDELPADLASSVHCLKFDRFTTATGDFMRNPTYMDQIAEVAAYIHRIYQLGNGLECNCAKFQIPPIDGNLGFKPKEQAFPGHSSFEGDQ